MTYDDLPILGRAPNRENLWLATGHGMMGMGMSAITGHLLADLITGESAIDPGHRVRAIRLSRSRDPAAR